MTQSRANLFRYPPGSVGRRHIDPIQEEVFVVLDGTLTIHMGEDGAVEQHELAKGSVLVVQPGTALQLSNRHGTSCACSSSEPRRSAARRPSSIRSDGRATRRRSRRRDRCSRSAAACARGYDARRSRLAAARGSRAPLRAARARAGRSRPARRRRTHRRRAPRRPARSPLRQHDADVDRAIRHLERDRRSQVERELGRHRVLAPATLLVDPDLDRIPVEPALQIDPQRRHRASLPLEMRGGAADAAPPRWSDRSVQRRPTSAAISRRRAMM